VEGIDDLPKLVLGVQHILPMLEDQACTGELEGIRLPAATALVHTAMAEESAEALQAMVHRTRLRAATGHLRWLWPMRRQAAILHRAAMGLLHLVAIKGEVKDTNMYFFSWFFHIFAEGIGSERRHNMVGGNKSKGGN